MLLLLTATAANAQESLNKDSEIATIFIYRDAFYGVLYKFDLRVNNNKIVDMPSFSYIKLKVRPGVYKIQSLDEKDTSGISINAESNTNYFVNMEIHGLILPFPKYITFQNTEELQATKSISRLNLIEVDKKTLLSLEKNSQEEISQIKTETLANQKISPVLKENEPKPAIQNKPPSIANTNLTLEKNSQEEISQIKTETLANQKISPVLKENEPKPAIQNKPPSITNTITAKRLALVIGNDTYKSVTRLENAREDARTIASNMTSVGYEVTLKLDLNEKEMKTAFRTFASKVEGGDEVLFFYAGHGVQFGSTNYLLPVDVFGESEAQVKDEAIPLQRFLDDMSERKAKFTLAMIDACRDNPFKSSGRAIGVRGLAPTNAATGQMIIFAAGSGQQALDKLDKDDKNKNGLFTRVFVQEMQTPNLTIDRVIKNVRNKVAEMAKSVGHAQVPAIYDQVLGDFYFKK